MTDKKIQRKECLRNRDSLLPEERKEFSQLICKKLEPYLQNKNILSYSPSGSEVDVSFINDKYDVAYPVVTGKHEMKAYKDNGKHIMNSYGILEPDPESNEEVSKDDLDVIIVPCVGFNEKRMRLGHGGGYYDVYLKESRTLKIGVAYEIQKLDDLIYEDHDIKLDLIITERNTY
ncbi:MAG: 5-formyltetrahydrofolate cyclo-ligase [Erysipelotrichaceae bacterium]|nr:5-formyltetrahydrofolate cyclo-ligase [Erysipelotrichaceae bacterium]